MPAPATEDTQPTEVSESSESSVAKPYWDGAADAAPGVGMAVAVGAGVAVIAGVEVGRRTATEPIWHVGVEPAMKTSRVPHTAPRVTPGGAVKRSIGLPLSAVSMNSSQ